MKKVLLVVAAVVCCTVSVFAQDDATQEDVKGFDRKRLFVGGNFGLTFGNFTFINVSPQLGYRFNDFFAAGIGDDLLLLDGVVRERGCFTCGVEDDCDRADGRRVVESLRGKRGVVKRRPISRSASCRHSLSMLDVVEREHFRSLQGTKGRT